MSQGTEDETRGSLRRLWDELKRRRVVRTALWYGGSVWALLQGAEFFVDFLGVSEATIRTFAALALAAFPAVVVLSWSYDITSGDRPEVAPRSRAARGLVVAGGLLASVVTMAFLVRWTATPEPASPPVTTPPARVAVLPFDAPASEPDLLQFANDLHQRIIDGLSPSGEVRIPAADHRLRVISRAGVLPYAGGELTTDSIGRALGVGTLVEGGVDASGGLSRVRLRVIDAASGEVLTSYTAEADRTDLLALADSATMAVQELRSALGVAIQERQRLLDTSDRRAYEMVVAGQAMAEAFWPAFRAGAVDQAARYLASADSLLAAAAEQDPGWAEPVLERGFLSTGKVLLAAREHEDSEPIYREGLALAEEGLRRDPGNGRALYLRGTMRYQLARLSEPPRADSLRSAAEADLRQAARTSRRPAAALRRLAELLAGQGRVEEALAAGTRAYEEDPYLDDAEVTVLRLFEFSLTLGRDADAARWCREGARRFRRFAPFYDCLLVLQAWTEVGPVPPDSAAALVAEALRSYPEPLRPGFEPRLQALLAASLAKAGEADSARAVLARARRSDDRTASFRTATAGVLLLLGDTAAALATLDTLLAETPEWRSRLQGLPELRPLADDPRLTAPPTGER